MPHWRQQTQSQPPSRRAERRASWVCGVRAAQSGRSAAVAVCSARALSTAPTRTSHWTARRSRNAKWTSERAATQATHPSHLQYENVSCVHTLNLKNCGYRYKSRAKWSTTLCGYRVEGATARGNARAAMMRPPETNASGAPVREEWPVSSWAQSPHYMRSLCRSTAHSRAVPGAPENAASWVLSTGPAHYKCIQNKANHLQLFSIASDRYVLYKYSTSVNQIIGIIEHSGYDIYFFEKMSMQNTKRVRQH